MNVSIDTCYLCEKPALYAGLVDNGDSTLALFGNGDSTLRACGRHVSKMCASLAERASTVMGGRWMMHEPYTRQVARRMARYR
jgi:hypothetical protein